MERSDVILIGAGPIGIELAVELQRAGIDYLHLEAGNVAQTITWYPHQVRFFSSPERIAIAGVPLVTPDQSKASREEYLAYLRSVVQQFDLPIRTFERVTNIERTSGDADGRFIVTSEHHGQQRQYASNRIILAIGDMHRPRKLNIPGEDLPHVSHYFDEPHRYFRQRLLIVGGKNSAVEAALRCWRAGAEVAISYRGEAFDSQHIKYWLLPEIKSLIKQERIAFYPCTVPIAITPDHVTLHSTGGEEREVAADFVLLLTGYEMDHTLFRLAGIDTAGPNGAPVLNEQTMETSVPGIYVAGTAAAGTQNRFHLFIENCHVHVDRIIAALTGGRVQPASRPQYATPET